MRQSSSQTPPPYLVILFIISLMIWILSSCTTTRQTLHDASAVSTSVSDQHSVTFSYTDAMRSALDSIRHKSILLDSLILATRESLVSHSGSHRLDSVYAIDSMAIVYDSEGNPHFHHYHNTERTTATHDTIFVASKSQTDSRRITTLIDSLSVERYRADSLSYLYHRLDSIYNARLDSICSSTDITRVKENIITKSTDLITVFIIFFLIISAIVFASILIIKLISKP